MRVDYPSLVMAGLLCTTLIKDCRPLLYLSEAEVVAFLLPWNSWPWCLSSGSDASSSLPTIVVPPHLGPGCPWQPQGAVAALPQEEPLPCGGGPCLPLLVSNRGTAIWVTSSCPAGTVPCLAHLYQTNPWTYHTPFLISVLEGGAGYVPRAGGCPSCEGDDAKKASQCCWDLGS